MSAPSSAYNGLKISDITTTTDVLHSEANTFGDDLATIKLRFYLDDVFPSQTGFVGCCYAGSFNDLHHNASRYGSLAKFRETTTGNGNWKSYKLFVDAGLNTKADGVITQIKTTAVNYIKVLSAFKSAYYDGSTEHGYYVKGSSDNTWRKVTITQDYQNQNTSIYPTEIASTPYNSTQIIYIKPYVVNPEGEYQGPEISFGGTEPIYQFGAMYRTSVCDSINQNGTIIWMRNNEYVALNSVPENTNSSTSIYGYQDDEFSIPIPSGYYAGLQGDTTKVFVVDNSGQFTSWIYCMPPEPPKDVNIYIFQQDFGGGIFYSVSCVLNSLKSEDVIITGYITSFDSNNNSIGGSSGDGYFIITIPAGSYNGSTDTTYQPPVGAAYSKVVVNSITPSSLTYEAHQG